MRVLNLLLLAGLAACAPAKTAAPEPPVAEGSVVPGTIGVAVERSGDAVVVSAVGRAAERAGIQIGDHVVRYNGQPIRDVRQFERLVLDSIPGSLVRIEVSRGGATRRVELPVEQIRTAERV